MRTALPYPQGALPARMGLGVSARTGLVQTPRFTILLPLHRRCHLPIMKHGSGVTLFNPHSSARIDTAQEDAATVSRVGVAKDRVSVPGQPPVLLTWRGGG